MRGASRFQLVACPTPLLALFLLDGLVAGDPSVDARVPADQPIFGSPDGIWVDGAGIVWIQTDISNSVQNRAPNYGNIGNNQMLAADPQSGTVKRFLTGPRGCEITGVITTPDQRAKELVEGSKLADPKVRLALYDGGAQAVAASTDPMIVLARDIDDRER